MSLDVSCISGWNMIGLPVNVDNNDYQTLFENAVENTLFSFGDNGGYIQEESLETGTGYWLRITDEYIQNISGLSVNMVTISLVEGWNLISSISYTIETDDILDPDGLIVPNAVYRYDEGGYVSVSSIEPGKGYWMRSLGNGEIIISNPR